MDLLNDKTHSISNLSSYNDCRKSEHGRTPALGLNALLAWQLVEPQHGLSDNACLHFFPPLHNVNALSLMEGIITLDFLDVQISLWNLLNVGQESQPVQLHWSPCSICLIRFIDWLLLKFPFLPSIPNLRIQQTMPSWSASQPLPSHPPCCCHHCRQKKNFNESHRLCHICRHHQMLLVVAVENCRWLLPKAFPWRLTRSNLLSLHVPVPVALVILWWASQN